MLLESHHPRVRFEPPVTVGEGEELRVKDGRVYLKGPGSRRWREVARIVKGDSDAPAVSSNPEEIPDEK